MVRSVVREQTLELIMDAPGTPQRDLGVLEVDGHRQDRTTAEKFGQVLEADLQTSRADVEGENLGLTGVDRRGCTRGGPRLKPGTRGGITLVRLPSSSSILLESCILLVHFKLPCCGLMHARGQWFWIRVVKGKLLAQVLSQCLDLSLIHI